MPVSPSNEEFLQAGVAHGGDLPTLAKGLSACKERTIKSITYKVQLVATVGSVVKASVLACNDCVTPIYHPLPCMSAGNSLTTSMIAVSQPVQKCWKRLAGLSRRAKSPAVQVSLVGHMWSRQCTVQADLTWLHVPRMIATDLPKTDLPGDS